jgi:hypothetical protein
MARICGFPELETPEFLRHSNSSLICLTGVKEKKRGHVTHFNMMSTKFHRSQSLNTFVRNKV